MYEQMNCSGCYKAMLPRVLSETAGTAFSQKKIQYFCPLCGHEQAEVGGGLRPWFKKTIIVVGMFILVTTFLYAI